MWPAAWRSPRFARVGSNYTEWIRYSNTRSLVYVWGYNGYCRLGLGNQQDMLTPKVVPNVRVDFVTGWR